MKESYIIDNSKCIGQIYLDDHRDKLPDKQSPNFYMGFGRDLSRITFSYSLRRLADKTQVFPSKKGDHYINRLTHSILVSNIARDIVKLINVKSNDYKINIELVEAIAIGHDVGHSPYGHIGEREVAKLWEEIIGNDFSKHNLFSAIMLQKLEKVKKEFYGYDLCWQTIDGILKHTEVPKKSEANSKRFLDIVGNGNFTRKSFIDLLEQLDEIQSDRMHLDYYDYPFPLTIEGQIVKAADEIAQYFHDLEDLVREFGFYNVVYPILQSIQEYTLKNGVSPTFFKHLGTFFTEDSKIINLHEDNNQQFLRLLKSYFVEKISNVVSLARKGLKFEELFVISKDNKLKFIRNLIFTANCKCHCTYEKGMKYEAKKDQYIKKMCSNYQYINSEDEEMSFGNCNCKEKVKIDFGKEALFISEKIHEMREKYIFKSIIKEYDEVGKSKIRGVFKKIYDNTLSYEKISSKVINEISKELKEIYKSNELDGIVFDKDTFLNSFAAKVLYSMKNKNKIFELNKENIEIIEKLIDSFKSSDKNNLKDSKLDNIILRLVRVKLELVINYINQSSNSKLEEIFYKQLKHDVVYNEIEKKYILKNEYKKYIPLEYTVIEQYYLDIDRDIRIRKKGNVYIYTDKVGDLARRKETELLIDKRMYNMIASSLELVPIIKRRYKINSSIYVYEIDEYMSEDINFSTVEVEFDNEIMAKDFVKPSWFDKDVTMDKAFKNKSLFFHINKLNDL